MYVRVHYGKYASVAVAWNDKKTYVEHPSEFLNRRIGFKMAFEVDVISFFDSILKERGAQT